MRGMGRIYKRGSIYWISYYRRGEEFRESSKSTKEAYAKRLLKKRLGEIGKGTFTGPQEERVFIEDLLKLVETDHILHRRRSPSNIVFIARIREHFGFFRAVDVTPFEVDAYIQERLNEGKAPGTVNRELNVLRRAFRLGVIKNLIAHTPHMKRLPDKNVRQGFFEYDEIHAVISHLPLYLKDFTLFGYISGWRRGEISGLEWADVNMKNRIVYLPPQKTKTDESRVLTLEGELWSIMLRRWQERHFDSEIVPWVFHNNGARITYIQRRWDSACKKAGVPGKLFHDLRRTAVRNMVRAGVPERIAMSVSGHRSRDIFDRYNIVNETDQRLAMRRVQEYAQKHGQNTDNLSNF